MSILGQKPNCFARRLVPIFTKQLSIAVFIAIFSLIGWIAVSASLFGYDFIEYISYLTGPGRSRISVLWINGFIWGAALVIPLLFSGRIFLSVLWFALFVGTVSIANHLKLEQTKIVIQPFDLYALRNAGFLLQYVTVPAWLFLFGLVSAILTIWLKLRRTRVNWSFFERLPLCLVFLAFSVLIIFRIATDIGINRWFMSKTNVRVIFGDPVYEARTNGLGLSFLLNIPSMRLHPPEGYSDERARHILSLFPAENQRPTQLNPPTNIVAIMVESLFDIESLDLKFNMSPIRHFKALSQEGVYGSVVSPVFGGNTANAEFELLTGLPLAALPPYSIPYQNYLSHPISSIVRDLAENGYHTSAFHNYTRGYWRRSVIYPFLGFEDFYGLEDMNDSRKKFGYPDDEIVFDKVLHDFETSKGRQFRFAVTVNTHGPYSSEIVSEDDRIWLVDQNGRRRDDITREEQRLLIFANRLYVADERLGAFMERIRSFPETVVIVFGDHQPIVSAPFIDSIPTEKILGSNVNYVTEPENMRRFVVPMFVWHSEGRQKLPPIEISGPLYCFGAKFFSTYRLTQSRYSRFLVDRCRHSLALSPWSAPRTQDLDVMKEFQSQAYYRMNSENIETIARENEPSPGREKL